MANIIKPKRTTTPGNNPTTTNLAEGEIAINLADRKIFVRDTSNNILHLPGATDDLTVENDLTVNGSINSTNQINLPSGNSPLKITSDYQPGPYNLNATGGIFPVDLTDFGTGWFLATTFLTENNENVARIVAHDTGGGDDGSHDAGLVLHGGSNYVRSLAEAGFGTQVDLTLESDNLYFNLDTGNNGNMEANVNTLTVNTNNGVNYNVGGTMNLDADTLTMEANTYNITVNSGYTRTANNVQMLHQIDDAGTLKSRLWMHPNFTGLEALNFLNLKHLDSGSAFSITEQFQAIRMEDYGNDASNTVTFIRQNKSDGVNDDDILDGSECKFVFEIRSANADTTGDSQILGSLTAVADSSNGNSYALTLDDNAQTGEVNRIDIKEDRVTVGQAFTFKNFGSDPSGLPDGSVYYNDSTHKLRLKANGTWVDLN